MLNIKNFALGIAIFILTLFVGIYGLNTLYGKSPQYNDFCPSQIYTEEQCVEEGGTWIDQTEEITAPPIKAPSPAGFCDIYEKCNKELESAQEKYSKKIFLTAIPLGIAIIALGALIFGLAPVGSGLMAGGVGIIVYGAGDFWRFADNWLKFVLSLAGLVVVIALAYYTNKRWKRNF